AKPTGMLGLFAPFALLLTVGAAQVKPSTPSRDVNAAVHQLISHRPHPESLFYFGGVAMPSRPDIADPRREPTADCGGAAGLLCQQTHTFVEVAIEPPWAHAFGIGNSVRVVGGYITWF